jgi:O-antigen ligase
MTSQNPTMALARRFDPETVLYYAVALAFLAMSLGTSPMQISGGLVIAVWLFSGLAFRNWHIIHSSWLWPILLLFFLPWFGLIYAPKPNPMGLNFATKTHYWINSLAMAALTFKGYKFRPIGYAFLAGVAINAVLGLCQMAGIVASRGEYFTGFGRQYNTLSAYLIIAILVGSYYFKTAASLRPKTIFLALMGLYFAHLMIIYGRTGYLAFLLLSPLVVKNLAYRLRMWKVLIICLMLPGLMVLSPVVRHRAQQTVNELRYHINAGSEKAWGKIYSTHQDRFYMWQGALQILREHPIMGVGTGGYQEALKQRGRVSDPTISQPHNDILYMAASYGLLGVLAYTWFYVVLLKNAWCHRHSDRGSFVLYTVMVLMITGMLNGHLLDAGTVFLLSLVAGLQQGWAGPPGLRRTVPPFAGNGAYTS